MRPIRVRQGVPSASKGHFGSHPQPVFSISYRHPKHFHGGNTGSNPVGDATLQTTVHSGGA